MKTQIKKLTAQFYTSLSKNKHDLNQLMILEKEFLGKKGVLFGLTEELKKLPNEQKPVAGKLINILKKEIIATLKKAKETLQIKQLNAKLIQEGIDITLPAFNFCQGIEHPINQIIEQMEDLFLSLGYEIKEGNEMETDFYNFEMLNMGKGHPARAMQDSFYIDPQRLLRTHTSNVQVQEMKVGQGKPLKIISSGKVYRKDNDDFTHSHQFMQLEGFVVDKNINFSHLKETLLLITKELFGTSQEIHLRPSYFPFTEPSIEVDLVIAKEDGTKAYLEILGAGLVHPQVIKNANYDPDQYQGFAFGIGIERIAMIKYQIENIRHFYTNDIRFLKQFTRNNDNENY